MLFFCFVNYYQPEPIQTNHPEITQNAPIIEQNKPQPDNHPKKLQNALKSHPKQQSEQKPNQLNSTNPENSVELSLKSNKNTAPHPEIDDLEQWDVVLNNKRIKREHDVVD